MTKAGITKQKICQHLRHKPAMIIQLSSMLNLSNATIFQHIQDLLEAGVIKEKMPYPLRKKFKYYELKR